MIHKQWNTATWDNMNQIKSQWWRYIHCTHLLEWIHCVPLIVSLDTQQQTVKSYHKRRTETIYSLYGWCCVNSADCDGYDRQNGYYSAIKFIWLWYIYKPLYNYYAHSRCYHQDKYAAYHVIDSELRIYVITSPVMNDKNNENCIF